MAKTQRPNITSSELVRICKDAQANILATIQWTRRAEQDTPPHTSEDLAVARLNLRNLYAQLDELARVGRQ